MREETKSGMKLEKWYTVLVWIITMFFCCFEISIFIRGYMQYKTTTKIKIEYEDVVRIPAVVTCFDTFPHDNVSNFFHEEIKVFASSNMTIFSICDKCISSDGLLMQMATGNFSQITLLAHIKPFSKGNQICLHASLAMKEINRTLFFTSLEATIVQLRFVIEPSSHGARFIEFYLTPYDSHFFHPSDHLLMTSRIRDIECEIPDAHFSYERKITIGLPAPYDTNCFNYSTRGHQTQQECQRQCMKAKGIATMNMIHPEALLSDQDFKYQSALTFAPDECDMNATMKQMLDDIWIECHDWCADPDCLQERFHFSTVQIIGRRKGSYEYEYALSSPDRPTVWIEAQISMQFPALLVMIVNSVSLWTAFCPMNVAVKAVRWCNHRRLSKRARKLIKSVIKTNLATKMKIVSSIVRSLVVCLCLSMCIWQLYESANYYFQYPTVTKVLIAIDVEQKHPSITICDYNTAVLSLYDNRNASVFVDEAAQLRAITWDPLIAKREVFIHSIAFCTTAKLNDKERRADSNPHNRKIFELTVSGRRWVNCILHDGNVYGKYENFFSAVFLSKNNIAITFSTFRSESLPAPYDTHCRDYHSTEFQSQHHCIESCAIEQSLKLYGTFPLFTSASFRELDVVYDRQINLTRVNILNDYCKTQCPEIDCDVTDYATSQREIRRSGVVYDGKNYDEIENNLKSKIILESSTEPVFESTAVASMDPTTFITNFLGCIAFWTGCCPLGLLLSDCVLRSLSNDRLPIATKPLYRTGVIALLLAGFAYQVVMISKTYFTYTTVNKLQQVTKVLESFPVIDVCHQQPDSVSSRVWHINDTLKYLETRSGILIDKNKLMQSTYNLSISHYLMFGLLVPLDEDPKHGSSIHTIQ